MIKNCDCAFILISQSIFALPCFTMKAFEEKGQLIKCSVTDKPVVEATRNYCLVNWGDPLKCT